jgi:deoxyribose-phosphate aldolase
MIERVKNDILEKVDFIFDEVGKEVEEVFTYKEKIIQNIKEYRPNNSLILSIDEKKIAQYFDHTYLKPDCKYENVDKIAQEALSYNFKAICIPPTFVGYAKSRYKDLTVATVIGFPLGYTFSTTKEEETLRALSFAADEIDMVQNFSMLKNKQYRYVIDEIISLKKACGERYLKVILETSYLTFEEKIISSILAYCGGADFIKTSTGFSDKGATLEDIVLMKMIFWDRKVKASGGVKTLDFVKELIEHGVDRIGSSSSCQIVEEFKKLEK